MRVFPCQIKNFLRVSSWMFLQSLSLPAMWLPRCCNVFITLSDARFTHSTNALYKWSICLWCKVLSYRIMLHERKSAHNLIEKFSSTLPYDSNWSDVTSFHTILSILLSLHLNYSARVLLEIASSQLIGLWSIIFSFSPPTIFSYRHAYQTDIYNSGDILDL